MFITKAKHQRIVSSLHTEIDNLHGSVTRQRERIREQDRTILNFAEGIADRQGALEHTQRQLNEALATIEALRPKRDARGRFI